MGRDGAQFRKNDGISSLDRRSIDRSSVSRYYISLGREGRKGEVMFHGVEFRKFFIDHERNHEEVKEFERKMESQILE